jgi:uncharacterized membrane protein
MRVLLVGETWVTHSVHVKGFDSFTTSEFGNGGAHLLAALKDAGCSAVQLPAHLAGEDFPGTREALDQWDVVILSDIGANSILLPNAVFKDGQTRPNPLVALRDWVLDGGAVVMCGGYLSFSGFEAKAHYHRTPVEEVLPVVVATDDDRVECPEGRSPEVVVPDHPVVAGLAEQWPAILGYNRATPTASSTVLATVGDDPFVVVAEPGKGRSLVWMGDVGPHWAPTGMVDSATYQTFWGQAMEWLCRR